MASTRSAHGSLNTTKTCKHLLISIGHCCSTLVEGSSRPDFGLRLALQPPVSASNDGIISFSAENQWLALRTAEHTAPKVASGVEVGGLLALQVGVKSDHLAAAWAFKIVATAMRAEQVALFGGQSGPTSTCLVNSHYVLGSGWEWASTLVARDEA